MKLLVFLFPVLPLACISQTGPGGVGSSTSNVLWLDASSSTTVSSGNITAWGDRSGNGFVASPTVAASQPSLVTNSVNGFSSLKFDGTNDELQIADNTKLRLTQWHFFLVLKVNTQKDYNAWLTKGNDGSENYEMLCYSDGHYHTPILFTDNNRAYLDATAVLATTTEFNVFEYSYAATTGRRVYKNYSSSTNSDSETRTPATNTLNLYIGNERGTSGRFINANIAEIIMYNTSLNAAQRIITNNYLAAKYNISLGSNDLYTMDNSGNGNYDYDVGGIGQASSGNAQSDSKGSGIVRILNPTGMDDGDYYLWGHDNGTLGSYNVSDVPSGVAGRVARIWRGSMTGTFTNFDLQFDLTGLGSVTASDLRLLIDTNNNGVFSDETTAGGGVISGASSVGSNVYQFDDVTGLTNGLRFTIGTSNTSSTPLPVTLAEFTAFPQDGLVTVKWTTLTEKNTDRFTVERSRDGISFEPVAAVKAAGYSNRRIDYSAVDEHPRKRLMYYRLREDDVDGRTYYSRLVSVLPASGFDGGLRVFPNPSDGLLTFELADPPDGELTVEIMSSRGKKVASATIETNRDKRYYRLSLDEQLSEGMYIVQVFDGRDHFRQLVIVR